jgi:iron complex transport system substrate-binding protein
MARRQTHRSTNRPANPLIAGQNAHRASAIAAIQAWLYRQPQENKPMKRRALILALPCAVFVATWLCAVSPVTAAEVTDATGRTVAIPDQIERVLPAGPPAAVLLSAIAPDHMVGFPLPVSEAARAALAPAASGLPIVPRLTGQGEMTAAVQALHPDLIIDYGNVSPRYKQLAQETQQKTGVPTLLFDGALDQIPSVARTLGKILHQPEQAEAVARFAEGILALPMPANTHPHVLYARGADGLVAAAPGTDVTAVFARLGWQAVAPDGTGTFRQTSVEAIRTLDPDVIILSDPAGKDVLASAPWASLRAVRDGHAFVAPSVPFGWVEGPPSINRLLGVAWLRGGDPLTLAALFNSVVYGRVLTQDQLVAIAGTTPLLSPWPTSGPVGESSGSSLPARAAIDGPDTSRHHGAMSTSP